MQAASSDRCSQSNTGEGDREDKLWQPATQDQSPSGRQSPPHIAEGRKKLSDTRPFGGRGKLVRIAIGLTVIGLAVWTFYPGLFLPIGTRAVVNARVLTVRAPISGVMTELNAKEGVTLEAGQALGEISNQRADPSRLEQLRTESAATKERTTVLKNKILVLEQMKSRLEGDLHQYREVVVNHYDRRIAENQAVRVARAARTAESESNLRRHRSLLKKNLTSEEKVDNAKRQAEVDRAELSEIDHVIHRLTGELEAARSGVFLSDGFNNVPYSQQRMDEITVTLASTRSDLDEALIRARELEREIEIEGNRHDLLRRAELAAPHTGPVWRNLVNIGEYVEQGTPLIEVVDPSELFLLVHLDVRHFDTIAPGDIATIELLGSDAELEGRVVNLRGGRAIRDKDALAVSVPAPNQREFRVMVAVDARDLGSEASDFLQIGRVARVRIHVGNTKRAFDLRVSDALATKMGAQQAGDGPH